MLCIECYPTLKESLYTYMGDSLCEKCFKVYREFNQRCDEESEPIEGPQPVSIVSVAKRLHRESPEYKEAMPPNDLSKCCDFPVCVKHGCDSDINPHGEKCTCEIVTCWYECTKCDEACDVKTN